MTQIEFEQYVETVARALCRAHGLDPDRQVVLERLAISVRKGPQWRKYTGKAKEHIAAFETLKSLEQS